MVHVSNEMSQAVEANKVVETNTTEEKKEVVPAEAATEATPKVVEEKIDLSKHFAELKRRDREVHAEKQRLKAEMQSERSKWEAEFKSAPVKKLMELGLTPDELTNQLLGFDKPAEVSPQDKLAKELEELKAWKQAQEDARTQAHNDKIISDFKSEVFAEIEKEGDKFELVLNTPDGKDLLWNSVVAYCQQFEEKPNFAELAAEVEAQLFEKHKQLLTLKKFKLPSSPTKAAPGEATAAKETSQSFKTLSNRMSATASTPKVTLVDKSTKIPMESEYSRYMAESRARILAKLK